MVKVVNYKKKYADAFKAFNVSWLEKYFIVEPYDTEVLTDPEKYILSKGGKIYFVMEDKTLVGTIALMYNQNNELELTKMAIDENFQNKGYGNLLMEHCIKEAKNMDVKKLILYSNTLLTPAIRLYRKFGFEEVDVENSKYERCNIKMVKKL